MFKYVEMFRYVLKIQFFKFFRNMASDSIFCPSIQNIKFKLKLLLFNNNYENFLCLATLLLPPVTMFHSVILDP